MNIKFFSQIVLTFLISMSFFGCTAIEKSNATDTEQKLAAAGFKIKFADTPGKLAHIKTMQQREVVSHIQDGTVYYAYADAEFCKCLYMGTETNYQEFEKLTIEQNTAEMNQEAAENWGEWGGWGGWGPWY